MSFWQASLVGILVLVGLEDCPPLELEWAKTPSSSGGLMLISAVGEQTDKKDVVLHAGLYYGSRYV